MGHLTEHDRMLITVLREAGVLAEVAGRNLDLKDGVIMIPCADGDQMCDLFEFKTSLFQEQQFHPRIHTLALNGGALLIPANSPVQREGNEDTVILQHLRDGQALKGINLVVLYAHAPCGAAGIAKLNSKQVIELLIAAKTRVKEEIPGLKVACFCHVEEFSQVA